MNNTRKHPSTIAVSSQPQQSCVDQSSHFNNFEFKHLDSELELQNKNKRQTASTISRAKGTLFITTSTVSIILLLLLSSLMAANGKPAEGAAASDAAAAISSSDTNNNDNNNKSIKIIFSDLDGTLIHYPPPNESKHHHHSSKNILELPKSSTGKVGVISSKTLSLVETLRQEQNVKFVLISGMRTSTLLQRLPYLPKADAYASENGGRIFYPIDGVEQATSNIQGDDATTKRIMEHIDSGDSELDDVFWVQPKAYKHEKVAGSSSKGSSNNRAFGIREDKAWRKRMVAAMGGDSIGPFTLQEIYDSIGSTDPTSTSIPLHQRDGLLWDFCRDLIGNHGYVVDTKGYSTCFRINKKQQTLEELKDVRPEDISALLQTPQWASSSSKKIDSSVNLSCVDFYPSISGKKNCCLYLASKFFADEIDKDFLFIDAEKDTDDTTDASTPTEDFLSKHAVCMCDDDNDLEMALACQHAYLPDIASESMRQTVAEFPTHFTTCFREKEGDEDETVVVVGTDASDVALSKIWKRISAAAAASRTEAAVTEPKSKSIAKAATSSMSRILRFAKKNFVSVMGLAIAMAVVSNKKEDKATRRPRHFPWLRQKPLSA